MSEWDDRRVEEAFSRLYQSTTGTIVTPEIEEIVQRAQRHRTTNVVVMLTVMVAVVGVIAVTGLVRRDQPVIPAEPSPSATEPVRDARVDPAVSILSGFLDSPELRETTDTAGESRGSVLYRDCVGAPADQLQLTRLVGDTQARVDISLALYDSEEQARTAFAAAKADLRACVGFPGAALDPEQWSSSHGDESVALTFRKPADGAGELTDWPVRVVTVRVGRAVETFFSMPYQALTDGTGVEAATKPQLEGVIAASLPRLCLFTATRCQPATGLPVPLRQFARDQEVFLLVLRVYATDDTQVRPGTVLAVAAGAGYHPSIVRQGCDLRADFAEADTAERTRYLALYFLQRNEADEVAAELIDRDTSIAPYLDVLAVQTRCV